MPQLLTASCLPSRCRTHMPPGSRPTSRCLPAGIATKNPFLANDMTVEKWKAFATEHFGDRAEEFLSLYPGATDEQAVRSAIDYGSDAFIAFGTWKWIEAQQKTGDSPVYRYHFELAAPPSKFHPGYVRLPLRRHRVCLRHTRHAARRRMAAGRPQAERADDGLLDQLRQNRRSQRPRPSRLAEIRRGQRDHPPGQPDHFGSIHSEQRYEFLMKGNAASRALMLPGVRLKTSPHEKGHCFGSGLFLHKLVPGESLLIHACCRGKTRRPVPGGIVLAGGGAANEEFFALMAFE